MIRYFLLASNHDQTLSDDNLTTIKLFVLFSSGNEAMMKHLRFGNQSFTKLIFIDHDENVCIQPWSNIVFENKNTMNLNQLVMYFDNSKMIEISVLLLWRERLLHGGTFTEIFVILLLEFYNIHVFLKWRRHVFVTFAQWCFKAMIIKERTMLGKLPSCLTYN